MGRKTGEEKPVKKAGKEIKITNKTKEKMLKIEEYINENKETTTKDIAEYIGLKVSRNREILSQMNSLEAIGTNTNRRYRLKNNSN